MRFTQSDLIVGTFLFVIGVLVSMIVKLVPDNEIPAVIVAPHDSGCKEYSIRMKNDIIPEMETLTITVCEVDAEPTTVTD